MRGPLEAALTNPWRTLDTVVDGPLHPGGIGVTERLLDRAAVGPETRVLDVGCGAGEALAAARDRGADAVGVDRSTDAAPTIRGDATELPVRDRDVDVLLAECVLCLTDLPVALREAHRVLTDGGRLALSDVVVDGEGPALPDLLAEACCLDGARSRDGLLTTLADAGFRIETTRDHEEEFLAMRDRVTDAVDYRGLLGSMGERGRRTLDAIERVETAVEAGDIGYVSVVATR